MIMHAALNDLWWRLMVESIHAATVLPYLIAITTAYPGH